MAKDKMIKAVETLAERVHELVMNDARELGLPCAAVVGILDMAKDAVKEEFEKD